VPVPISPSPERTYSTDGSGFPFKAATLERVVKPALGVFHGWDGFAKGAGVARHTPDVCGEGRLRPHLLECGLGGSNLTGGRSMATPGRLSLDAEWFRVV
jgi:hypothetical protein